MILSDPNFQNHIVKKEVIRIVNEERPLTNCSSPTIGTTPISDNHSKFSQRNSTKKIQFLVHSNTSDKKLMIYKLKFFSF